MFIIIISGTGMSSGEVLTYLHPFIAMVLSSLGFCRGSSVEGPMSRVRVKSRG
jgi:hypothetical protein